VLRYLTEHTMSLSGSNNEINLRPIKISDEEFDDLMLEIFNMPVYCYKCFEDWSHHDETNCLKFQQTK